MPLKMRFSEVAEEIRQAASEALLQTGHDIYDLSQQLVPVDTGLLKRSGGVVPESSTRVVVGYGGEGSQREEVSTLIEYGSSNSAAQPYLTPAFATAKQTFEVRLKEKLNKVK